MSETRREFMQSFASVGAMGAATMAMSQMASASTAQFTSRHGRGAHGTH